VRSATICGGVLADFSSQRGITAEGTRREYKILSGSRFGDVNFIPTARHHPVTAKLFDQDMSQSMPSIIPVQVEGKGRDSVQEISVPDKSYKIRADTHKEVGGTDTAPTPAHIALASLSSCMQLIAFMTAKAQGIMLGEFSVTVEGTVVNPAMLAEEQAHKGWENIFIRVPVQTDIAGGSEATKFKDFVALVERKCPMTGFFRAAVPDFCTEWVNETL
jgi:uncharacterized OsmC-like protein